MEYGQLHHVEYYVNDLSKTKKFWGWFLGKFGYSEYQKWETGVSYAHKNETYIVFVEVDHEHREFVNNRQAAGLNHIAFKGGDRSSLKTLVQELNQMNIKIQTQRDDAICFIDPNNFAVEVFC